MPALIMMLESVIVMRSDLDYNRVLDMRLFVLAILGTENLPNQFNYVAQVIGWKQSRKILVKF